MKQKLLLNNNVGVFFLLGAIGLLAHYRSLSLGLYGDDWLTIYLYFVPEADIARFGPLPGLLSFLTPYGPSILLIGGLFSLFNTNYIFYYKLALILRVFTAFSLYLACQKITKAKFVSFLVSLLFLVGFTGLQTTDWVFYMNIYLASGIFILGLFYKFKFLQTQKVKELGISVLLDILSIVIAPLRLFPVIVISPVVDLFLLYSKKTLKLRQAFFFKNIIFALFIFIFWKIGVFGSPGGTYSPGRWGIGDFFSSLESQPIVALKSFFYWVGTIFIPSNLILKQYFVEYFGALFLLILVLFIILSFRKVSKKKFALLSLGSSIFLISLVAMWWYAPLRFISSEDRYLLFLFVVFCLLLGILITSIASYLKTIATFLLITLIVLHIIATQKMYGYWLTRGRDAGLIKKVDTQIMKDFPKPLTSQNIIFLDFDDGEVLHSVQFGLAFKILVLSKTWDQRYLALVYNEKKDLINAIKDKITQGISKEKITETVYAYQFKNKTFSDITIQTRQELLK